MGRSVLLLASVCALSCHGLSIRRTGPLNAQRGSVVSHAFPRRSACLLRVNNLKDDEVQQQMDNEVSSSASPNAIATQQVWESRQSISYTTFKFLVALKEAMKPPSPPQEGTIEGTSGSDEDATKNAVVASALAVIFGAFLIRFGGRAALMSVLGLDIIADMGVGDKIDDMVSYANQFEGIFLALYFIAWAVAKTFLLDFISVTLALSSGILFGGIIPGALMSATAATTGSLVGYYLSQNVLKDRVSTWVDKQPVARGLQRVVERNGFKTIFVLRLSPVLPIPLGAYNYIYGAANISTLDFIAATWLGSLKPYLLDSYLGVFSKSLLDGDSYSAEKDALLLVAFGALVLVSVFASELAGNSFEEVKAEMKEEEERLEALGLKPTQEDGSNQGEFQYVSKWSSFDATQYLPNATRTELNASWLKLEAFMDWQWNRTIAAYELELAEAAARSVAFEPSSPEAQTFKTLARRSEEFGALQAQRKELEAWDNQAGLPRLVMTSVLFSFALLSAIGRKWEAYESPNDEDNDQSTRGAEAA